MQAYSCSLVRGALEETLAGRLEFLDGVVFPHTCDSIQRLSDIWRMNVKECFHLDVVGPVKLDTDSARDYMAAVLRHAIDSYIRIAGYDISRNPGLTATLYNLGNVTVRADELRSRNYKRKQAGKKPLLPRENYYGWLVNQKLGELRSLL